MKTVIEMAHETLDLMAPDDYCREPYWTATDKELEAFAELVRADAIADEREACAKVCEDFTDNDLGAYPDSEGHGYECAEAIRARGNT